MSLSGNTFTTVVHEFNAGNGMWTMDFEGGAAPASVLPSSQGMAYVVDQGIAGSGAGSGVTIMDTMMNMRIVTVPVSGAMTGVLRPDQSVVYVGAANGSISILDTTLQQVTGTISLGTSVQGAPQLAASSDSKTLYATYLPSTGGSALAVINTSTNHITNTIVLGTGTLSAAPAITLSSSGSLAYAALTNSSQIAIVDLVKQQVQQTVNLGSDVFPNCIGIQPGGMSAYVPSNTGVVVFDLTSNTVAGTIQISGAPQNVAFTMDGSMAFVSVMNGNAVIIDTAIDKVIQQLSATDTLGVAIM
jgi:DNA-binding beta-propeller fold protein YncE